MRRPGMFAALLLTMTMGVARAEYADGVRAWGRGDFAAAAAAFLPAARAGDADAQYMLGRLYAMGAGVPQDYAQAWMWHDRAARHGHAEAAQAREVLALLVPPARRALPAPPEAPAQTVPQPVLVLVPRNGAVEHPLRAHLAAPAATEEGRLLAEADPRLTVRAVQRALAEAGHSPGAVDGALGPATRQAIRAWQSANNVPATGLLDEALMRRLGLADQQQAAR